MVDLSSVRSLAKWPTVREQVEAAVREVLGNLPNEQIELQIKVHDEDTFDGFSRRRINYFVDEWTRVSAWLFLPEQKEDIPAILCCHQTVPQGKDEPAGIEGDPMMAFARHYAELGYATLAPDTITAGERHGARQPPYDTKSFYKDRPKMSALGKMMLDHKRGLDVLSETRGVDPARLGVAGHSLGGHNALMLAAFDERVQACVASCAFTRFEDDQTPERWAREEGFVYLPNLRPHIERGEYPFDWEHVLALAAPTPIQLLTAKNDDCFSNTDSVEKAVKKARRIYKLLGKPYAIDNHVHDQGHRMTPDLLDAADTWFERWL